LGQIRTEVSDEILSEYPDHKDFLIPFLTGFFVTWGRRRRDYNTEVFEYFLSPEDHFKETYGFENEVLLVYAPYSRMEPRTIQAVEQIMSTSPAKGRVETLSYFLVTDCPDMDKWLESYLSSRQESRIIVPFYKRDVVEAKKNSNNWFVRNTLNKFYFGRDLFNYSLPLIDDAYFFGRQAVLMEYYDSVKRRENKAVFGLRKTGKTSFLYKLKRLCESEKIARVLYFDCKVPHIRKSKWNDLLSDIAKEICEITNSDVVGDYTDRTASKDFEKLIGKLDLDGVYILVMLDEIEYISFISPKDTHWKNDYVEFWQTMWSCQSRYKSISFILSGVNPSVVEKDLVGNIQNPLFGIVTHKYLTGLNAEEVKTMVRKLGKRMGLRFDYEACQEIYNWYGGHPLLTRQACSNLNTFLSNIKEKPIEVTKSIFLEFKQQIDRELVFYSDHAVSEIRQFYPDEYYLFELLSIGQELEFKEFSSDSSEIKHLLDYQLIRKKEYGYEVNIPVIASRVAFESRRSHGRDMMYPIVESKNRDAWLKRRLEEIISEFRQLERFIKNNNQNLLFGANSFPEADQLNSVSCAINESSFSYFINSLNRSFVESIDVYGKSIGNSHYYWNDIKSSYPQLWDVLDRIKVYRNERDHLHLNNANSQKLNNYLNEDFEGKSFSMIDSSYFVLQQRVLDRLLLALLREIDRFN
jgi:hypothetical protein